MDNNPIDVNAIFESKTKDFYMSFSDVNFIYYKIYRILNIFDSEIYLDVNNKSKFVFKIPKSTNL